jgi:hypothetical protein
MARRNPQVEHLEHLVSLYQKQLDAIRADPGDLPVTGCGDSSCVVARPRGQHTNSGCRCDARELRRALLYYQRRCTFLQETIKVLRDEVAEKLRGEVGEP